MEFISHKLAGRVIFLLLLAIVSLFVVLYRIWTNFRSRYAGRNLLRRLDKDIYHAQDIEAGLEFLYGSISYESMPPLRVLLFYFTEGEWIGKFEILRKVELPTGDLLFATLCKTEDFGITIGGFFTEVNKDYQINFCVKNNRKEHLIEVYSDLYESLQMKLLRQDFARELFALITEEEEIEHI